MNNKMSLVAAIAAAAVVVPGLRLAISDTAAMIAPDSSALMTR